MIRPDRFTFARLAADGERVPVVRELTADTVTPLGMLLRLRRTGRHPFLLESVEGGERVARWSFAGADPERVVSLDGGRAWVDGCPQADPPLDVLRREVVGTGRASLEDLPPFCGGAVGWLGYDTVRLLERLPDRLDDPIGVAEGWFGMYPVVAALDRVRQRLMLVALADPARDGAGAWERAVARLDRLEQVLAAPLDEARPAPLPAAGDGEGEDGWQAQPDPEAFREAVARSRKAIGAGEIFQIVLSRRWSRTLTASPVAVYRALRLTNPAPYMFYIDAGATQLLGSSPETLVRVRGDEAVTCPIAGTRRRGRTAGEDLELERELAADEKERAEHLMLLDLGRNDLGRVAAPGSVRVTRHMEVERYSHVMHLVSEVRARLQPGRDALDALAACFPAGTLSGAPKVRAMELIEELETVRRGVYGGAVGYFDAGGDMDTCIAIRTAVVTGGEVHVQAGAGIVFDSDPASELAECERKAAAVRLAVRLAEGMTP